MKPRSQGLHAHRAAVDAYPHVIPLITQRTDAIGGGAAAAFESKGVRMTLSRLVRSARRRETLGEVPLKSGNVREMAHATASSRPCHTIDHTATVFLFDRDGEYVGVLT